MAIAGVSLGSNAVGAGTTQAQPDDARKNPLTIPLRKGNDPQLSLFGKTKLTLDDLKASAQALRNLSNPPTLADFKVAVQGFVQSLNVLSKTVNGASAIHSANSPSPADARPANALNEIRKAVSGPAESGLSALRKLGISAQQDGTFGLNQRQLENSFQQNRAGTLSALFEVADRVESVASQQLSGKKPVGGDAGSTGKAQEGQGGERNDAQARLESRKSFQQLLAAQLAHAGGYVARNAVATYFSVAAL